MARQLTDPWDSARTMNQTYLDGERWLAKALKLSESDTPFPWQLKLLRYLLNGHIEDHLPLDIPTGLGKTSVMAIWLVARALGANLPRRLVYIVDRRAVVDQSTEVAQTLRDYVDSNSMVKTKLGLGSKSLPISTLRGQHIDNREWLKDPSLPAIIVGTVDMIGSRLMFEGYGTSHKMRPYHAGLLGSDALVVLDEAHLVPPFEMLLKTIATDLPTYGPQSNLAKLLPPFRLMTLTATARSIANAPFGLTDADFEHKVAKQRLYAKKRMRLESTLDEKTLPNALAEHAWELSSKSKSAVRLVVFCHSPKDAENAKAKIEKIAKDNKKQVQTQLLVGGRRIYEREMTTKWLLEHGFLASHEESAGNYPAFVFATSAGEVGIDLNTDHLLCDLVAWERMIQRLGRVNRKGNGLADVIVVYTSKKPDAALSKKPSKRNSKEKQAVEEYERRILQLKALKCLPQEDGVFDASPNAILLLKKRAEADSVLKSILDDATTKPPLRPKLSRALVDAWSMTSLKQHTGRPRIQPWLRGWDDHRSETVVVWREHLPVRDGKIIDNEAAKYFEVAPPHLSEKLETYTSDVINWLKKRAKTLLNTPKNHKGNNKLLKPTDIAAIILDSAGEVIRSLLLKELDQNQSNNNTGNLSCLSGATLVVDARIAGLRDGRLNDKEDKQPSTADGGGQWCNFNNGGPVTRFRVRVVNKDVEENHTDGEWWPCYRFSTKLSSDGEAEQWLVVDTWRDDASMEDSRSAGPPQLLDIHQQCVEKHAKSIAEKIGLSEPYVNVLSVAARLHDEGKRSRRWQSAFNAPQDGNYAKTHGPIKFSLLAGYRHEFGSLAYAEQSSLLAKMPRDDRDLALHLIASHHGFARPIIRTDGSDDAPPSTLEGRAQEVALRFIRLQRRWGPWGLAWWETLLRSADWQASKEHEEKSRVVGR